MKKLILFSGLLVVFLSAQSQFLRQPIDNYTPSEYGQGYSSYNLAVAVDDNGVVYLGTAYGILQYDGSSWRFIRVRVGAYVTSLAVLNNTVYVGTQRNFGFLKPNELGKLEYQSLSENLHNQDVDFNRIWATLIWNQSVVFQSEEKIYILSNDSIAIYEPKSSFHMAFIAGDDLYVRERDRGLLKFIDNEFKLVPNGEFFSDLGIFAILPFENSKLIVTREKGLLKWENDSFTKLPISKEQESQLLDAEIIGGVSLLDGNYALNTRKNGIIILNKSLNIIAEYTDNSGMLSSEILDMVQDNQGNLWAATQRGASRIQYSSPFSTYNQASGLYGIVQAIGKKGSDVLVGTSVGLFVNHPVGMKAFEEVTKVRGSVWAIEETSLGLWIGTEDGLWLFDGKNYQAINHRYTTSLKYVPEKNWMISAGMNGVQIIDANTKDILKNISEIRDDVYGIAYKIFGSSGVVEIWIGNRTTGVWQLTIQPNYTYTFDLYMGSEDGLYSDWVCPHQSDDDVLFASSQGMLKFIYPEHIYALLNDSTVDIADLRGYFDITDYPKNSSNKSVTAYYHDDKESYLGLDYHIYSVSMGDSIPSNYNYKTLQLGRFNALKKWGKELYIGADGGLAIVNLQKFEHSVSVIPSLLLRSITMGYDSVIWYGDAPLGSKSFIIPSSMNTLSIELSSSYNDNGFGAQYSWMIRGVDQGYARWTPQGNILLSNLREGDYELMIVAKNIHDELGNEVKLNFRVLPPWYRTWWAITLYVAVSLLIVYFLIQLNIRRLKAQNKRLEEIVRLRTKEVVEQKEHIEHILEDIRSSISYAQRIQQALLPSQEFLKEALPNHFILFFPRDVVSGDFYWAGRINNWLVVTVVDCTGHGVPGAFMSMLGISFLHEIVRKHEETNAANILNELRKAVIEALKQTGKQNEQKDGMDMSLIAIDLQSMKCQWAGANNSLYLVRKNGVDDQLFANLDERKYKSFNYDNCELHEVKADKMPVAIHAVMNSYTNHEIDLVAGDRLYMFTDGFADQFGGNDCRKFMAKNFKELIAKTSSLPIKEQAKEMEKAFSEWRCDGEMEYEQIDDVTVMGIEV